MEVGFTGEGVVRGLGPVRPVARGRVWVARGAQVIGDVVLGDEVSVWMNAVIRGDEHPITIGPRTNIQDLVMCHQSAPFPLVIGADVTVGHGAILHGCTVGDGTVIGMGAIVLDGAVIGSEVMVGAGALVTSGTHIPDGTLVLGSPAQVRRTLTDEERRGLRTTAAHYVAQATRHATAGVDGTGGTHG